MYFYTVKRVLYFAANGSQNDYIHISETSLDIDICVKFEDLSSALSSHLISVILLYGKPHIDGAFKFTQISNKHKFAAIFKYDF